MKISKNISIYSEFGRNHPIWRLIFDQRLWWNLRMRSEMDRRDEATSHALEITLETPSIWSWSNTPDTFLSILISAVITLLMNDWDYIVFKTIHRRVMMRHIPLHLSDDRRSWFNRAIGRSTCCHIVDRDWSSIVIDQMLQIASRHLRANNKLKNWFEIRKKSLEIY